MKFSRPLIAALALLVWFAASTHVALEHGGERIADLAGAIGGHDHHHGEPSSGDEGHHHHHWGAMAPAQFAKASAQQLSDLAWVPTSAWLVAGFTLLSRADPQRARSMTSESPPDQRASGWLLLVQTALPVRGPSPA